MSELDLLALICIPLAAADWIALRWQRFHPSSARFILAVAFALSVAAGCWLHPNPLPLSPNRHWHWLPYAGLVAAGVGCITVLRALPALGCALLYLFLGAAVAFFLVPLWPDLKPSRPVWIGLLTVYLAAIGAGLVYLPERLRGRGFIWLLALAAAGTAVLMASEVSLRLGEVGLRVAAAVGGCWAAAWLFQWNDKSAERWPLLTMAIIPVYAILAGGSAFVAAIDIPPTKNQLLLAPAAPLALWIFAAGPLAKLEGVAAIAAQSIAVLLVPAILLVSSLWQAESNDEWSYQPPPSTKSVRSTQY